MHRKYKLLDIFCKAGGSSMGYYQAGFEVEGVDNKPQKNYPFKFHLADALTFPLDDFDVIHASPPCQKFSAMQHIHKNKESHLDLIEPIRRKILTTKIPFIIENVIGAPIRADAFLCGTMFGLKIIRHRIFETSEPMPLMRLVCNHDGMYDPWHGGEMARNEKEKLAKVMGIDWYMTRPEVREAIPPSYTKWIGEQILKRLNHAQD